MLTSYLTRRYLVSFSFRRLGHIFTDVLVIGAGCGGMRAALTASAAGEVIVTSKCKLPESNTYYAQGGMAAVMDAEDSFDRHIEDTIRTGVGLCDAEVVNRCIHEAPAHVRQLQEWGLHFDLGEDGYVSLGREGGHGANRIVHAEGDATGKAIFNTLLAKVRQANNIKIFEECFVLDLLTDPPAGGEGARCVGAIAYHPRYGMQVIHARQTILASGGAGKLWRETSNPTCSTGDGLAMAFRAGAVLADMEMMQFHPTTLYVAGSSRSLISEAVRGEGALLLDMEGRRFMPDYHEMAELAPRDVVSQAILDTLVKTGSTHVFLDIRPMGAEHFRKRFPGIDRKCREFGIDPVTNLIPVHPAAHYMVGGVKVDSDCRTSLENLLACGEAACTYLHGANRLASNSLLEALVFGHQAGKVAGEALSQNNSAPYNEINWTIQPSDSTELDMSDIRNSLRSLMWRNVGVVRFGKHLAEAIDIIDFWGRYVMDKEFFNDPGSWEVQNMLTSSRLIAELAVRRTESRGVHYRSDFPRINEDWARHQKIRRTPEQLVVD